MSDSPSDEVLYTLAERHPDGTHHANGSGPNGEPCIAAFGEYEDAARLADSRSSVAAWVRAERLREAERRAEALDWFAMVCRFSVAVDAARYPVPVVPPAEVRLLRHTLMAEELEETVQALRCSDLPGIADGLADLIYVAIGTAVAAGIDLRPVMQAVQEANLTKATGPVRADGKRGKPEGFMPPDVAGILAAQRPIPELGGQS